MSRPIPSLVALCAAMLLTAPALAADIDSWGSSDNSDPSLADGYPTQPGDWSGMGDKDDPLSIEMSLRYWYAMGSETLSTPSGDLTEHDNSHVLEGNLRLEDNSTNVWASANGGYSVKMDGSFASPTFSGSIVDGHVAYATGEIGWNALGDNNGSGIGPVFGYTYWQDEPDTGRYNFTTARSAADISFDPITGQTNVPGDSSPNHIDTNMLRLGVSGKAKLGDYFDISGEVEAVPYANVGGTVGVEDPSFSTAVYSGPAQVPYTGASGNISMIRSSPTSISGWGYGAAAEGWIGVHPTSNMSVRLGGRLWYLQGTVDQTYSIATIGDPVDTNADGKFDKKGSFTNTSVIQENNPFSMMRYGIMAEVGYSF